MSKFRLRHADTQFLPVCALVLMASVEASRRSRCDDRVRFLDKFAFNDVTPCCSGRALKPEKSIGVKNC
jgi:hypothetical protein